MVSPQGAFRDDAHRRGKAQHRGDAPRHDLANVAPSRSHVGAWRTGRTRNPFGIYGTDNIRLGCL